MKLRILSILLIICSLSTTYGQRKKITRLNNFDNSFVQYGYYLGFHYKGYELKATNNVEVTQGAGFQLGVLADLNLGEYVSLIAEPGVVSTTNKLKVGTDEFDIPTTHFHMPISLKFKTKRINNVRGFILTGVSYNYNFSSEKNKGDNGAKPNDFLLKQNTFMGEIAIGANFYFPYFKFSPSIRGVYGFNNEFEGLGANIKNEISSLKSRGVFLTLIFQ